MALNRRDFIGAMIASTSLGTLRESLAAGQAPSATEQGKWLRNGMVDAGGNHEPLIFIVRRGGQSVDALATSRYQQSEELIRKLHEQGVEVFHTSLYKGFGMAAEKEGMEQTRDAVAIAHRYGMKADTYVQWGSLMYETFFAEEPRAEQWIERDIAGLPILLTYGYQQSFRYMPCFSHQEYIDYLKKVIHYAIVDVKTDFIHLDNFNLNAEPDSCHCPACVAGFRKFLNQKYSPKQLRERFGFENISFVNPPQWNRNNPPDKMEIIYDPGFQEWVDFRCQLMADALGQISAYAKSLNPEVAMEINPGGLNGENHTWMAGVDHSRLLKFTECFWSEEANPQAFHADGRLVTKIRTYKMARVYNNVALTSDLANNPVALGETLAFNQTIGCVGLDAIVPVTEKYIGYYSKNRDLYMESEDVGPVAVYRSYASLTYHQAGAQLSAILTEQALIQSRIPFVPAFDEHLNHLSAYKVLILPDTECLSDEQIALIRRYVENGGGLVVTGQSGLYDEWRRVRTQPGLHALVENQNSGTDYQEKVMSQSSGPAAAMRKQVGRGRVAYLSAIEFDGTPPPAQPYFTIDNRYWKRPKNWQEMIDAVNWAAGDALPFTVDGPEFLAANYTYQPRQERYLIHLVNYNAANVPLIKDVQVQVALPGEKRAARVTQYDPERADARAIHFTGNGTHTRFTVPEMGAYALIAVQL